LHYFFQYFQYVLSFSVCASAVVALITEIMRFSISPEADADELLLWVDIAHWQALARPAP
jgi:hypothetical protein